ncbi:4'-phosphopantetheinyl transferase superfamily protein [Acinetobacter sp.]|uniref:4'-phosphopantetheinyl transferase family protein n=1 Tax=Acinetobacter sp. TaxID=472 RepID=UPI00264A479F|nr:4'-phosphopantetheinyl transferase superfamily protein [Acinetobacter sp.]MDN5510768.1 4'-phosphopantetheinyl transferase superfamily protein [Acinetobacter sp.]MDN5525264.1 4'-phosphopantetheinyl transferase superfamily protein [Acinetobacter sp.]
MSRWIRVEVNALERIVTLSNELDRKAKIQLQKQQIYHYRNQLLSEQLQTSIQQEQLATTEYGKPYLINFPQFYFNHSHSQKNYALATSSNMPDLGVDIEDLDRKVRFEALANHAFHPHELTYWNELEQDAEYWFKVWTTKEAVLKAAGLGVRLNLNELDTHVHPLHDGGLCSHPLIGTFAYQNFHLGKVMLTVAWRSEASCKGFAFPEIKIFLSS